MTCFLWCFGVALGFAALIAKLELGREDSPGHYDRTGLAFIALAVGAMWLPILALAGAVVVVVAVALAAAAVCAAIGFVWLTLEGYALRAKLLRTIRRRGRLG